MKNSTKKSVAAKSSSPSTGEDILITENEAKLLDLLGALYAPLHGGDPRTSPNGPKLIAVLRRIIKDQANSQEEAYDAPELLVGIGKFAKALRVSEQTVRNLEAQGKIFSVLSGARQRGRQYPIYQAWPDVLGDTFTVILGSLRELSGELKHAFFTQPNVKCLGLTPVDVWMGQGLEKAATREQLLLLQGNKWQRESAVMDAANALYDNTQRVLQARNRKTMQAGT